jgi:hypothetical protein
MKLGDMIFLKEVPVLWRNQSARPGTLRQRMLGGLIVGHVPPEEREHESQLFRVLWMDGSTSTPTIMFLTGTYEVMLSIQQEK